MNYREAHDKAAEIADQALSQMKSLSIAAYPDNYEIWYSFHAGLDAELSRKLTGLLENTEKFDPNAYASIKQSFLGEETSSMLQSASDDVEATIVAAIQALGSASDTAKDYQGKLEGFTGGIKRASPEEMKLLVAKIVAETKEVIARNTALEADLSEATQRIEALRDSLDDARRASETDGLTGLPNRRAFDLGLEIEIDRAREEDTPLTLLVADIDHFKNFNDTYGHRVGDEVLKLVGRVLKSLLKGRDTPARYGGEEFCVILPTTDLQGASVVAEHIRKSISAKALKSARTGQCYGQVTISIGCAQLRPDDTSETLIERADRGLYLAKRNGRNRVELETSLDASPLKQVG